MAPESGGPYLQMAIFCERVLQERDGVISAIRIIDRITRAASGPATPEEMPPVPVNLFVLLAFKSGSARGRHTVHLRPEDPSGLKLAETSLPILFEAEDQGAVITLNLGFEAQHEGLYWFDVSLDEELITRMPLRVVYQRLSLGSASGPT